MSKSTGKRIVTTTTTVRKTFDRATGQNTACEEETKEKITVEIDSEEEIADLIRKALGVPKKAEIEFDCGQEFLRGCIVTYEGER